jgi:hypothetical protein
MSNLSHTALANQCFARAHLNFWSDQIGSASPEELPMAFPLKGKLAIYIDKTQYRDE